MSEGSSDRTPLLQNGVGSTAVNSNASPKHARTKAIVGGTFTLLSIVFVIAAATLWNETLPTDPHEAALYILDKTPAIDGHIDLPDLIRKKFRNNATAVDLRKEMPGHVDIPRLRKGRVGGFFWSVYAPCEPDGPDFITPTNRAGYTLEQIDVSRALIDRHSDVFQFVTDVSGLQSAMSHGKIASILGAEGAHQLDNSLGTLRAYYTLGVRYLTLAHFCNNAFADSGGFLTPIEPKHGGLSPLGRTLVREMNRLGMLVDISHTSDATAMQTLALTKAPVMFSHSSARAVWDVARNVPDVILESIGLGEGKRDAVVMVNFAGEFVGPNATLQQVADHIEHIGKVSGRQHVGLGSDFDGIDSAPKGMEDVSKYPDLFAELISRGWSKTDLAGLAGENLIRVWKGVEAASRRMQSEGVQPAYDVYDKREDL
ncbi:hypothetical protein K439DRAFT_1652857 [Ramaria rubella]|nr:hypothetical protein K439DRAFT_1652857 [Ramaria rubella]